MTFLAIVLGISFLLGTLFSVPLSLGAHAYPLDIVVVVIAGMTIITRSKSQIWGWIWPFVAAAALSLAGAIPLRDIADISEASLYLVRWVSFALVGVWVTNFTFTPVQILKACYFVTGIFAAIGIMQFILYPDLRNLEYLGWDPHFTRLFGVVLDPNFAGIILVLGFILGLWLLKYRHGLNPSIIILQLLHMVAIVLTFSRSTFITLFAGVLMWGVLSKKMKYVLIVFSFFLVGLLLYPKSGEGQNLWRIVSTEARMENMIRSWSLFRTRPILGYGFNTLRFIQCPPEGCTGASASLSRAAGGLDNSYLFILVTTGAIGFSAFSYLIYRIGAFAKALIAQKETRWFGILFFSSIVSVGVHALFINSLFYPWVMVWMWSLVGVGQKLLSVHTSPSAR